MNWIKLKKSLFADYPLCQLCRIKLAEHLHHAIITKGMVRDKKKHKYLNVKENALEICTECHTFAGAYKYRRKAWKINCARYGNEHMSDWLDALPLLIKERFE